MHTSVFEQTRELSISQQLIWSILIGVLSPKAQKSVDEDMLLRGSSDSCSRQSVIPDEGTSISEYHV